MHARVVTAHVGTDKVDEAIALFRDSVIPAARQQEAFSSARFLVDRSSGKIVTVGLWETSSAVEASGEQSEYYQEQVAKFADLFTQQPVVENFEVALEM